MKVTLGSALVLAIMLVAWCMLSFDGQSVGASQTARQPFGNAVEQRNAIIKELREIKALLKEQNSQLRAAAQASGGQP
jgi:hypothetical protein